MNRSAAAWTGSRAHRIACLAVIGLFAVLASVTQAATLTVTSSADSGTGTLRNAIANASPGDTIVFASDMTIVVASTLVIGQNLTIDATGRTVAVDGNQAVGVFKINTDVTARITHLVVQNGYAGSASGIFNYGTLTLTGSTVSDNRTFNGGGGGILNYYGTLKLIGSTVSNNRVSGNNGGGILNFFGNVTLTDSVVSNNNTSVSGGGIDNEAGSVTLIRSTLSGNKAGYYGGGIYNYYSSTVALIDSTVSDNSAVGGGGGIYNLSSITLTLTGSTMSGNSVSPGSSGGGIANNGAAMLTNSTVSDNVASNYGGGIYSGGTLTLINDTVSGNSAAYGGGIANNGGSLSPGNATLTNSTFAGNGGSPSGGGLYNNGTGTITLTNAIVADGCTGPVAITDNGGNLDSGTSCAFSAATSHGNATLDLGTLADNGGPTRTILPGAGSAAINAVSCANAPSVDQRGYLRPDPGSVGVATPCDVGAVEVGSWQDLIFASGFESQSGAGLNESPQ